MYYPPKYNSIVLDSQGTHTETPKNPSLSLSPGYQNMEGETDSYTDVHSCWDIRVLPADLPNLMRDRQGWANFNPNPTSVD